MSGNSMIYYDCNQISYRWDNARRDRMYGKIANQHATVDTSEFADKVCDYDSRAQWETQSHCILRLRIFATYHDHRKEMTVNFKWLRPMIYLR